MDIAYKKAQDKNKELKWNIKLEEKYDPEWINKDSIDSRNEDYTKKKIRLI